MSLLKEHIRNMVKGIINEYNSPDQISLYKDGVEQKLRFRDNDAIGFFLRGNGDFYCGKAMTHSELKYDYIANKLGFKTNDEYNDYIDNNPGIESEALEEEFEAIENDIMSRGSECIEGRYWYNNNIIAFWCEVPQFEEFKKIINGIASFIHSNININDVTIAVDDFDLMFAKDYFSNGSDKYNNIDKEKSEELRALHLMNAEEKAQTSQMKDYLQNKSENTGKKLKYNNSKGEMPMAQWRALHSTSENKHNKINIEMPNKIKLTENELRDIIKQTINEIIDMDNNSEENSQFDVDVSESIDAWDLSNILEKYGWCYTDSQDIFDKRTQRSGVRYVLRSKPNAEDFETVVDEIKRKAIDGEHTIETSSAYYKYDPSKTIQTLIVWETTLSPQMTLQFESQIKNIVKESLQKYKK